MKKLSAFTLSEAILALAIMGVLAALVMPSLFSSVQKIVLNNSEKVNSQKLSNGMTLLSIKEPRIAYNSSEAFVNDLKKYVQISKVCNSENLSQCWPYEKLKLSDGTEYSISSAKEGKTVFLTGDTDQDGNAAEYSDDNAAFVLNNGVVVLLNYNKKCSASSNQNKNCYVAAMELNGDKAPNTIGKDIVLINTNSFVYDESVSTTETTGDNGVKQRND